VSDIPDQTIAEGGSFTTIRLDDYVSDVDNTDAEMTWTFSGNSELSVTIDGSRVATIGILTAMLDTTASNGMLTLKSDGSFTYTPNSNFNNTDTFTYHASDGTANSNVATVTITVGPVNDPPIAYDDTVLTDENTSLSIKVTLNDDDPDGTIDPTTITIAGAPVNGTVQVAGDGTITYSPNAFFSGIDQFTYTVEDNEGATSNVAMVMVTVVGVNDPPIAGDDFVTTKSGVPVSIAILSNDSDPDGSLIPETVTMLSEPESGTATVNLDGTITYTSVEGFVGTDQFTYRVEDAHNTISNEATVTVEVLEMCGEGGDNKCAAQEAMSTHRFLKHDTNNISWLVLVDPEEKERSYYILIVDSTVLEEFALSANIQPTETHAGAPLEVGLELSAEERRTRGWPWIRVTGPDLAESANGGAAGIGVGYSFSGRSANGLYWLGINTSNLPPGRYNFWIVYGERKTLLVPILVLP
jgi:VCBS repeat-containing protein